MKKSIVIIVFVAAAFFLLTSCSSGNVPQNEAQNGNENGVQTGSDSEALAKEEQMQEYEKTVIGFSQIGAESDWRSANTASMQATFTAENGYELLVEDGQQKQSNQIKAIRIFIQREVDYIILAPVVESGWDTVLQEAKDAGIPVIILDRMIDTTDKSLYAAWVGSDFKLEGQKVGKWINQFLIAKNIAHANIVDIQGNIGATAQIGRSEGIKESCEENDNMSLIASKAADFTQARGREVMTDMLEQYDDINIAYCENDNEAFGVIEAIEAAGKKAGSDIANGDIMVVSFDGVNKSALQDVYDDKISCIAECNPNHGPQVRAVIEAMKKKEEIDSSYYIAGALYAHDETVPSIFIDGKEYHTTIIDKNRL